MENIPLKSDDISVGAELEIVSHGKTYKAEPIYLIKGKGVFDFAKKVDDAGLKLRFSKILPDKNKVEITVYQQPESQKKYIVMKAIKFPYINFFWAGTVIMVIGFFLSILRRNKEQPAKVKTLSIAQVVINTQRPKIFWFTSRKEHAQRFQAL